MDDLPNQLLEAALRYAELGYPVFPCAPGGKKPLTEHGFHDATTDSEQIEAWWREHPCANIGMPTAGMVIVDIDDPATSWVTGQDNRELSLLTGPLANTPRGGRHCFFRQPAGKTWRCSEGKLADRVDVRAEGGYVVVAPSVNGAGRGYEWVEMHALDGSPASLPEPPAWLIAELDAIQSPEKSAAAPKSSGEKIIPEGRRNSTLASVAGSLRRLGLSVSEIAATLLQANTERCRPPLPVREVEQIARSMGRYEPDGVTESLAFDDYAEVVGGTPLEPSAEDPGPFPESLLSVPGFIGEVVAFNLATATRPQPVLALAGAIALQCVLAGRKVKDERGNRTNIYIIGIAPSGAGKDHARKVNKNLLFAAGLGKLEGNEDIASDAGLVSAVEVAPAVLFQIDEIGRFLRTIGDPKRAPHLYNVLTVLMKFFSSGNSVFRGKAYADADRNKVINQPCVVVYGTTIPEHLFESLTADSLTDGFIARLINMEAGETPPRRRAVEMTVPKSLTEAAKWWGDFNPGGNLQQEHPDPKLVPTTPEAVEIFEALAQKVDTELKRKHPGCSLWARAEEKACRLALAYACSRDRVNPVIDAAAARWACEFADYVTRRMLYVCQIWVADGVFDGRQKKVLRVIRQAGGRITRNELARKTQWLTQRERQEVIENLLETEQLRQDKEATGKRPRGVYVLA